MTEEAKTDWLSVAWETLKHLPADMLHAGCKKARAQADHPAKIVPIITAETKDWYDSRKPEPVVPMISGPLPPRSTNALMDARGQPMTAEETERLNSHLELLGGKFRYRPDGSRISQPTGAQHGQ